MRPGRRATLHSLLWAPTITMALGALGCVSHGPVRVAASVEPWSEFGLAGRRYETRHFVLISTLRDTEFEEALPTVLEAMYHQYETTLPPRGEHEPRLTTYLFGTRSEWTRFARRRFPVRYGVYSRIRSGGFSEGGTSVSFYVSRSTALATLAHEGWHQYVSLRTSTQIPAWLNEGLACYHEAIEMAGLQPRFTPERNTFRINSLREAIQTDTLMSLREIVDTDAGRVISGHHGGVAQTYYAQAWALVTFLRHGAGGRFAPTFDRMLQEIAAGTLSVRVSAWKVIASDATDYTAGAATIYAYFGYTPEELSDAYYDHLIRVAGF